MIGYFVPRSRILLVSKALVFVLAFTASSPAAEVFVTKTNWSERWITNLVEVSMPRNRFVDEYHTNWISRTLTNHVQAYATNWSSTTITNVTTVQATHTNFAQAYVTNLETVVLLKTNWVTQRVTNETTISLPAPAPIAAAVPEKKPVVTAVPTPAPKPVAALAASAPASPSGPDALVLEAWRTGSTASGAQAEVQINVKWAAGEGAHPQVQQWRVESDDGAVMCYGLTQEFKRELPAGSYKVTAKVQRASGGPVLLAMGTLSITSSGVAVRTRTEAAR